MTLSDQVIGELKQMHYRTRAEEDRATDKYFNATSDAGRKRWRDEIDLKRSDCATLRVVLALHGVP